MCSPRILSVTYQISLLSSRQAVLQSAGHEVQSASDLQDAVDLLAHRGFQVVVIGQDLPEHHQQALITAARHTQCKALLLTVATAETRLGADANVDPYDGPYVLLEQLAQLLGTAVTPMTGAPQHGIRAASASAGKKQGIA